MKNLVILFLLLPLISFSQSKTEVKSKVVSEIDRGEFRECSVKTYSKEFYSVKFSSIFEQAYDDAELIQRIKKRESLHYRKWFPAIFFEDTTYYRLTSYSIFPPEYEFEIYEKVSYFNSETGKYEKPVLEFVEKTKENFMWVWITWVVFLAIAIPAIYSYLKSEKRGFWDILSTLLFTLWLYLVITLIVISLHFESILLSFVMIMGLLAIVLAFVMIVFCFLLYLISLAFKLIIWFFYIFRSPKGKVVFIYRFPGNLLFSKRKRARKLLLLISRINSAEKLEKLYSFFDGNEAAQNAVEFRLQMIKNKSEV